MRERVVRLRGNRSGRVFTRDDLKDTPPPEGWFEDDDDVRRHALVDEVLRSGRVTELDAYPDMAPTDIWHLLMRDNDARVFACVVVPESHARVLAGTLGHFFETASVQVGETSAAGLGAAFDAWVRRVHPGVDTRTPFVVKHEP